MKRMSKLSVGAAVVVSGISLAGSAFGQEAGAAAGGTAGGEVGMTLPGAGGGPKAEAAAGESDHDSMIGHFAIGYMGARTVPFAPGVVGGAPAHGDPLPTVDAPTVGIRYWIDQMIGIDAGLGFLNKAGSDNNNGTSVDQAAITAGLVHVGVPLALAGGKHFSFQIVPELNVGFSNQDLKFPNNGPEVKTSGTTIQIGARAGGEVHFGFMGIPQLSLQAGVGVLYRQDHLKMETTQGGVTDTEEGTRTAIGTTLNGQPWDIFTSNVAALYYF